MFQTKKSILIVDDEPKILEVVMALFEKKGYRTYAAETGKQALQTAAAENLSLIILDLMLPDISGEEVCRRLRNTSRVPIIMLTAKSEEDDLLRGLGIGADDYLTKPFSLKELYARAEAILRRTQSDLIPLSVRSSFGNGDLTVDFEKYIFLKAGQEVTLTPNEAKILAAIMKYPGKVYTRDELITIALGDEFDGNDRTIDTHIKNLRQKIEDNPKEPIYIKTVHRIGYKFGGA
ncbi:MAG: response regulator transcription factor [Lachnospiraceae bacterium]